MLQNYKTTSDLELSSYRPDIDGLRAIAVGAVVAYHAFPGVISGGFVGVDIFFVISGYLISGIIFEALQREQFSFRKFYSRRIRRIFPALILVLTSTLVAGWFVLLPEEYKEIAKHSAAGASFISNFILWKEAGYFDLAADVKPLLHLWSLAIEEQFYLIWPPFLYLLWRRVRLLPVITVLLSISLVFCLVVSGYDATAAFFSPLTRAWELLMGALLAHRTFMRADAAATEETGVRDRLILSMLCARWNCDLASNLKATLGFFLLVLAIAGFDSTPPFPDWRALIPVMGTVLVIDAGPGAWINRLLLSRNLLIAVGLISYPLYLWHWPLLSFTRIMSSGNPSVSHIVITLFVSLVLAILTFRIVECPIRFGKLQRQKIPILTPLLAGTILIIGLLGWYIYQNDGFAKRARFDSYYALKHSIIEDVSQHNAENCSEAAAFPYRKLNKDFFCMKSSGGGELASNVIIGDSHAYPMYFGFYDSYVSKRKQDLLMFGANGCPPLLNLESFQKGQSDRCQVLMNSLLQRIANASEVKTVILVNRAPLYISGAGFGPAERHNRIVRRHDANNATTNVAAYTEAFQDTVAFLNAHQKSVVIVLPPPELGFEPSSCLNLRPISLRKFSAEDCSVPYFEYDKRIKYFRDKALHVSSQFDRVHVIDPSPTLCGGQMCYAIEHGRFLYSDNNHLSVFGARRVIGGITIPD